jgi:hypothetical protein
MKQWLSAVQAPLRRPGSYKESGLFCLFEWRGRVQLEVLF